MALYREAVWDYISGPAGSYTGGPFKVVHHKTQGGSLSGARSAYRANRSDPHFTVHRAGVNQHVDTEAAARALRNAAGGVQTNRDSAIQIEVVGFSGVSADDATINHLVALLLWIEKTHGVPWVWPEGRPPLDSKTGYGLRTPYRNPGVWDHEGGHYGHSQVPENTHWDPAYTDREWWIINALCGPKHQAPGDPAPIIEGDDMATTLVDMPAANGYGLAAKFVDFGREVVPVSATIHGPSPDDGDGWWLDFIGAGTRIQPRGTGVVVTVDGVKNNAAAHVWVTVT